jgi:hypothetical protein
MFSIRISNPSKVIQYSPLQKVETCSALAHVPIQSLPEIKRPGPAADHSYLSNVGVKN